MGPAQPGTQTHWRQQPEGNRPDCQGDVRMCNSNPSISRELGITLLLLTLSTLTVLILHSSHTESVHVPKSLTLPPTSVP